MIYLDIKCQQQENFVKTRNVILICRLPTPKIWDLSGSLTKTQDNVLSQAGRGGGLGGGASSSILLDDKKIRLRALPQTLHDSELRKCQEICE